MKTYKSCKLTLCLILCIFFMPLYAGTMDKITQAATDTSITTKILFKYAKNPLLNPFKIGVTTTQGVVSLSGEVNTKIQYSKAVELAQETQGVANVKVQNLKIKNSQVPLIDAYLTGKIRGLLILQKLMNYNDNKNTNINIEVKNRVVYVDGKVKNKNQRETLLKVIKSVDGIKSIKENISIQ